MNTPEKKPWKPITRADLGWSDEFIERLVSGAQKHLPPMCDDDCDETQDDVAERAKPVDPNAPEDNS